MSLAEDLQPLAPRFDSVEAFLAWVERQPVRYELVGGAARMMTGGTANHARISGNAVSILLSRLAGDRCEAFGSDFPVILGPRHVVYPDASVACEGVGEAGLDRPVLVVEVLSPSTAVHDLGDKAEAYRRIPTLRHLVLIHQDRVSVKHYHRNAEGQDFTLTELGRVGDVLALTAISVEIVLAELYARVTFVG